jgi:DHA2 family multidrug resistance protein
MQQPSPRPSRPAISRPNPDGNPTYRIMVPTCTILATLMQSLDSTIANVALPYMQGSMSASYDQINWVLTSYIVAAAIMTTPTGFLASRFGRTRLFVTSVVGFTLASILCALAQSLNQIVLFRIVQGGFGAALTPLSQAVMFDIYPAERRGPAMALWGVGVMVGPILGPTLGGWLTENYNWRWVFYINVPFGMIAASGLLVFLRETPRTGAAKLDWLGFGVLSLAIGSFQMMLDRGELLDWFSSTEIVVEACLAGLGLYCFLIQLSSARRPFLSPKLFTDVNFVVGVTFIFVVGLILYATLALLAPYLQILMNYPVVTAGIVLAPRGGGTMLAMMVCGWLVGKRVNTRLLVAIGFLATAYALYDMMSWTPDISERAVIVAGFIQGVSVGFVFVPLSALTFATLPLELRTQATGVYSLVRNIGSAIGISVTGALLQNNTQINHSMIADNVTAFNRSLSNGAASHFWNPGQLRGAAALNEEITRQASAIAYIDDFKLMLILAICSLPLVLLIRPDRAPHIDDGHSTVTE